MTSRIVRVEASVSFDRLTDGFFLQTSVPSAVVTRLIIRASGEIQDGKEFTPVGEYEPNQPFRVRMDIDMSAKMWSVTVDNELNGFSDDVVFRNLPFLNPANVLPQVGKVNASLSQFGTAAGQGLTTVAYDDISISLVAISNVLATTNRGELVESREHLQDMNCRALTRRVSVVVPFEAS